MDYAASGPVTHGFLRSAGGRYSTIDVPRATGTTPNGINNWGHIVGDYFGQGGSSDIHGFVLIAGRFTTIDLPYSDRTTISRSMIQTISSGHVLIQQTLLSDTSRTYFHFDLVRRSHSMDRPDLLSRSMGAEDGPNLRAKWAPPPSQIVGDCGKELVCMVAGGRIELPTRGF